MTRALYPYSEDERLVLAIQAAQEWDRRKRAAS